ncbi:MAG: class I mannose-6-phosphate isomerase [Bacteroidales bacterium]|jgi:mannose-6-phosphate isomerase|nr:class I mannose-6-phosphate isomerase [Bacteroidales bacterium]
MLYPLKFKPQFFEKIWGGQKIKTELGLDFGDMPNCGEAWLLSGLEESPSVVENGFLKDNTLDELVEIYMSDLVGEKAYKKFGLLFPLLIKWIDANDDLSVQVHPDDELAREMYGNTLGKTEMWYIQNASPDAKLICGLKNGVSREMYEQRANDNRILSLLKEHKVASQDAYYIPAGTVHSLRSGIILAEIQEASDLTFRIYDWDRKDASGKEREMHKEEALKAINFEGSNEDKNGDNEEGGKVRYARNENTPNSMIYSPFFQTNFLTLSQPIVRDFSEQDSFVAYLCSEGSGVVKVGGNSEGVTIKKGEIMLIPAIFDDVYLLPDTSPPDASLPENKKNLVLLETYLT